MTQDPHCLLWAVETLAVFGIDEVPAELRSAVELPGFGQSVIGYARLHG
jgi:hypothetical protein